MKYFFEGIVKGTQEKSEGNTKEELNGQRSVSPAV